MIDQKRIETTGRNNGHTEEDEYAGHQGIEFVLQAWIIVTKDQEHDQDCHEADRDSEAATQQDAGYNG